MPPEVRNTGRVDYDNDFDSGYGGSDSDSDTDSSSVLGKRSRESASPRGRSNKRRNITVDNTYNTFSTAGRHGLEKEIKPKKANGKEGGRSKESKPVAELRKEYGDFIRRELNNLIKSWEKDKEGTLETQLHEVSELSFVNELFYRFTKREGSDSVRIRSIKKEELDQFLKTDAGLAYTREYRGAKYRLVTSSAGLASKYRIGGPNLARSDKMHDIAQSNEPLRRFVAKQWNVDAYAYKKRYKHWLSTKHNEYRFRKRFKIDPYAITMHDDTLKRVIAKEAGELKKFDELMFHDKSPLLARLLDPDSTKGSIFNRRSPYGLEMHADMNKQLEVLAKSDNPLDQEVAEEFKKNFHDKNGNPYQFNFRVGSMEYWYDNTPENRAKYNSKRHLVPTDPDYKDPFSEARFTGYYKPKNIGRAGEFDNSENIDHAVAFNLMQEIYSRKIAEIMQREIGEAKEGINRPANARKKLDALVGRERKKVAKDQESLTKNNEILRGKSKIFNSIKEGLKGVDKKHEIKIKIEDKVDGILPIPPRPLAVAINPATLSPIEVINLTLSAPQDHNPFDGVNIEGRLIHNIVHREEDEKQTYENELILTRGVANLIAVANKRHEERMKPIDDDKKVLTDILTAIKQAEREEDAAYDSFKSINGKEKIDEISKAMSTAREDLGRWSANLGVNLTTDALATQSYDQLMNRFVYARNSARDEMRRRLTTPLARMPGIITAALAIPPGAGRQLAMANALRITLPNTAAAIGIGGALRGGDAIVPKAAAITEELAKAWSAVAGSEAREAKIEAALDASGIGCAEKDKGKHENHERLLNAMVDAKASKIAQFLAGPVAMQDYIVNKPYQLLNATSLNSWAIPESEWLTLSEDTLMVKINKRYAILQAGRAAGAPAFRPYNFAEIRSIKDIARIRFEARQEAYDSVINEFEDKKKKLEIKKSEIDINGISDEASTYRRILDGVDSIEGKIREMSEGQLYDDILSTEQTDDQKNRWKYTDAERAGNKTVAEVGLAQLLFDYRNDIIPAADAYDKYSKIMTTDVWRDLILDYFPFLTAESEEYEDVVKVLREDLIRSGAAAPTAAQLESIATAAKAGEEIVDREKIQRGVDAVLRARVVMPAPGAPLVRGAVTREELIEQVVLTAGVSDNVAMAILDTIRELNAVPGIGTVAAAPAGLPTLAGPGVLARPGAPEIPGIGKMAIETIMAINNVKPIKFKEAIDGLRERKISTEEFRGFISSGVIRGYVARKIEAMV